MIETTKFRKWIGAAAVAMACTTMASTAALAEPQKGGVLRYANQSGPGTLDPYVSSSAVELEIIHHLYDSLVAVGEQYETRPMIAKSIDIADEGKTFTFKLRTDVKFHDGSPLTSADAVASFERYRKISPNAVIFNDVASVEAPDAETFVVKLNKTNAVFVDILKSPVTVRQSLTVARNQTGAGTIIGDVPGIACGTDCAQGYAGGQVVVLTAAPASGSTFAGWSGACAGTVPTCSLTIDAAKEARAAFTASNPTNRPAAPSPSPIP